MKVHDSAEVGAEERRSRGAGELRRPGAEALRGAVTVFLSLILAGVCMIYQSSGDVATVEPDLRTLGGSSKQRGGTSSPAELYAYQYAPNAQYSSGYSNSYGYVPTAGLANDEAALTYDGQSAPGDKMRTLHALASAKKETQILKAGPRLSATREWTEKMQQAGNPTAALKGLSNQAAAGSAEAKQLTAARQSIAQVLQQSQADMALRKRVLADARTAKEGTGNTWNSLMSKNLGPHSLAVASDWLSTEVASTKSPNHKAMYARAQLAAALSQVGGKFSAPSGAGAQESREHTDKELSFESEMSHKIMYGALNSGRAGDNGMGSSYSTADEEQGVGGGQQGGGASSSQGAVAPGLSSYDAQILSGGPPS